MTSAWYRGEHGGATMASQWVIGVAVVKNMGMTNNSTESTASEVEIVSGPGSSAASDATESEARPEGTIEEPAKVMRIGSMIKQLLDEVRQAPLDDRSRVRMREIYQISVKELAGSLSPDLREELESLALPFTDDEVPSDAELRVAQAMLVGWLEGLFHGIQATLFAQQMAAQAQLQQIRQPGLPAGLTIPGQARPPDAPRADEGRPGNYL